MGFLMVIFVLGPTPETPAYETSLPFTADSADPEFIVDSMESSLRIKPGNRAEVIWADPVSKKKTEVALVYLHGFTASHREGFPTHLEFAKRYGCNLYLARLADHGLVSDEPLLGYSPDSVWESAKQAYAVGKKLGNKVIIMSTSTGGTLALRLAATYPEIAGLINYSPNIEINDPAAFMLNDPWGLQIARLVFGGYYRTVPADEEYKRYWYDRYRLEGIVALQELVESTCTEEVFERVRCPVFNGVYYKDEENQDPVVRVDAVEEMHDRLSTPENKKVLVKFPDAKTHVIANKKRCYSWEEVKNATFDFADKVLELKQVEYIREESNPI